MEAENKISKKEIAQYKEAFSLFDKENTGSITTEGLIGVFEKLGKDPNDQHVKDIINELDVGKDGYVTFDEFISFMSKGGRDKDVDLELKDTFDTIDTEKKGKINVQQI